MLIRIADMELDKIVTENRVENGPRIVIILSLAVVTVTVTVVLIRTDMDKDISETRVENGPIVVMNTVTGKHFFLTNPRSDARNRDDDEHSSETTTQQSEC
jgi:hypothetical protein